MAQPEQRPFAKATAAPSPSNEIRANRLDSHRPPVIPRDCRRWSTRGEKERAMPNRSPACFSEKRFYLPTRREALLAALGSGVLGAAELPVRKPKVEILWKSPDGHPNALEATEEGLWVGDQVTDAAHLLDWRTGEVLRRVETESYNTSGIAYGGGFLWLAANGALKVRPRRPADGDDAEVLKVDPATGKTLARFPLPGGAVHELNWAQNSLWITARGYGKLMHVDPDFHVLHTIPLKLGRAHGVVWDRGAVWVLFSNNWVIQRLDEEDGRVLEAFQLVKGADPEPHGLALYRGCLYYPDAGMAGTRPSNGKYAGYICRFAIS
jgi:streptogramin lyase